MATATKNRTKGGQSEVILIYLQNCKVQPNSFYCWKNLIIRLMKVLGIIVVDKFLLELLPLKDDIRCFIFSLLPILKTLVDQKKPSIYEMILMINLTIASLSGTKGKILTGERFRLLGAYCFFTLICTTMCRFFLFIIADFFLSRIKISFILYLNFIFKSLNFCYIFLFNLNNWFVKMRVWLPILVNFRGSSGYTWDLLTKTENGCILKKRCILWKQ